MIPIQTMRWRVGACASVALCMFLPEANGGVDGFIGFASAQSFHTGTTPQSIAIGDFNGDGNVDLAVPNEGDGGVVSIHISVGNGSFAPVQTFAIGNDGSKPWGVATGDLNGDGNLDLAVTNSTGNKVSVLIGAGDGSFAPEVTYAVGHEPFSIAMGDLDSDGNLDLAVANLQTNTVSILMGHGDGSFEPHLQYITGNGPFAVALGDLDGDGHLDMAVVNVFGSDISILRGTGDGSFAPLDLIPYEDVSYVSVGDLNGDDILDLAITTAQVSTSDVVVFLGVGDGSFGTPQTYPVVQFLASVAIGDVDNDGDSDLVTGTSSGGHCFLLLGHGDGTFATAQPFFVGDSPRFVALGDLDRDGYLDVAATNQGTGRVASMINLTIGVSDLSGDGTVNGVDLAILLSAWGPCDRCLGDLNGDAVVNGADLAILLANWQ